jgi:hypothetical protein
MSQTIRELGVVAGVKSFYRGYSLYMMAIMVWMSAMPATTEFIMNFNPASLLRSRQVEPELEEDED